MDAAGHRGEAERLLESMAKMTEDFVEMDMDAKQPLIRHLDLFSMIGRRAEIHALLSKET
jgi:hypothetical protein